MKRVYPDDSWPSSWKSSYVYDLQEIYGQPTNLGYLYAYKNRMKYALDMVYEVLDPGARILDIAAAQGNFSLSMAEKGYDVTWNDLRTELVGYVEAKHDTGTISFAPGNAFDLSFSDLFDAVLITEVIEHVAHPDDFLKKTASLVKPGGYIIMTTPNGAYFRNKLPRFSDCPDPTIFESIQFKPNADGHIFLLHKDEVEDLASKSGLTITRLAIFNNPLTSGHIKLGVFLKIIPNAVVTVFEKFTQKIIPPELNEKLSSHMAVCFKVP